MPTFSPTPEQVACIEAAASTKDNLLISALAGAAKTSTLVLMAAALPSEKILCLAFNRKIAQEMKERLPHNCTAQTLNSLGHRAWGAHLRKRLTLDDRKGYKIFQEWARENVPSEDADEFWEQGNELRNLIQSAKTAGWIPDAIYKSSIHHRLMDDADFFAWADLELNELEERCVTECTIKSIELGVAGTIDYDDQILLSTCFRHASFEYYPTVMVDEAQDLSAINHAMLFKLSKAGRARIIAVGDPCQAIYGFRGAHADSMDLLRERFKMRDLVLSTSFRCPRAIIRAAHWRAPHMRWPEWAIEGEVRSLSGWTVNDIPEIATILCRNNAPLFGLALKLILNGRYPELAGTDIGKRMQKIMSSFGSASMPMDHARLAADLWLEREKAKRKDHDALEDLHACIAVFLGGEGTLGDACTALEAMLSRTGPIKLMTGHKSKGLEFPNVFILDQHLIRDRGQDPNLLYVMMTRAQQTLTYVRSDCFIDVIGYEKKEIADQSSS